MIVKVIEVKTMFASEDVQYYLEDEKHNIYYWITKSVKAWDELYRAKIKNIEVQITSFKLAEKWICPKYEEKVQTIKNVRFRLLG